jgi:dihydroxyacid dehydratase/phosphogluconate dehydratase
VSFGGLITRAYIEFHYRCNRHLFDVGKRIKQSLYDADLIGYQFGTVGVSDGISMGTRGMSYSLQSRDLIADQVETAAGGHWLDGMVVVPGCDKNMPGVLMACRIDFILYKRLGNTDFDLSRKVK